MRTLECWSTHRGPFQAPEIPPSIRGRLDGKQVITSPVIRSEGKRVWTESGSEYLLGEPDAKWLEWLASNDYQFDPVNPIKTVKKLSNLKPPASLSVQGEAEPSSAESKK